MPKWSGRIAPDPAEDAEEKADDGNFRKVAPGPQGGDIESIEAHRPDTTFPYMSAGSGRSGGATMGDKVDEFKEIGVWHWLSKAARVHSDKIGSIDIRDEGNGHQTSQTYTYAQIHERAKAIANFLFSRGVCRHSRIGVFSSNCHDIIEIHFAAAALQATVVNLNVNLKPGELHYILQDSQIEVVFAHTSLDSILASALSESERESERTAKEVETGSSEDWTAPKLIIWLDSEANPPSPGELPCSQFAYDDCASYAEDKMHQIESLWEDDFQYQWYYTSGTTGKPKGVILRHDQICLHALATIEEMSLQASDVWGHISPMFHLVDAFAMYAITYVGGSHVVLSRFTARGVLDFLERERITCTNLASTMLTMLIHHPTSWGRDFSSLRIMSCGGSPQSNSNIKKTISIFGCEFFVSYGMTECCGKISMSILPKDRRTMPLEKQMKLICTSGRPFIAMEMRVLQEDGTDVVWDGQSLGEVVVRGQTVFDGYFRMEDSKSKYFYDDWFRTGDVAHVNALGYITIADRIKDMILCGGENVYCVEVENILHSHPAIKQAAVFGTEDDIMGELVNAAIVLKNAEGTGNSKDIRSYCQERLSSYKIPTRFHFLSEMPTTSSGKIMKNSLRDMFGHGETEEHRKRVSRTAIWELLGHQADFLLEDDLGEPEGNLAIVVATDTEFLERLLNVLHSSSFTGMRLVICTDKNMEDKILSRADSMPHIELSVILLPFLDPLVGNFERSLSAVAELILVHISQINSKYIFTFDQNIFEDMISTLKDLSNEFARQLTSNEDQIKEMRTRLQERIGEIASGLIGQEVGIEHQFMEYGMTSNQAVEFSVEIEEAFGLSLPSTLIFDYPTISDVSDYLEEKITTSEMQATAATEATDLSVRNLIATSLEEETGLQMEDTLSNLNSLQAVSLVTKLNSVLGIDLPSTLVFDYPDAEAFVANISSRIAYSTEKTQILPRRIGTIDKQDLSHSKEMFLVSEFSTKDSQHQLLKHSSSKDLITNVPLGRWDSTRNNHADFLPQFGFFLEDIELFDPRLFRISELEAVEMDPQQRKLLGAWSHCHYSMAIPKETAIYVGVSQLDYSILLWSNRLRNTAIGTSTFTATSSHLSVVSGRLSYIFGYTGQCLSIDTACSSSLVVVNLASSQMQNSGTCSAGISGVNLIIARTWSQACNSAGMLSMDGRCKVLDASADGYVRSEECASAYLTSCSNVDMHAILILSSAINQDGRSSTLTAPNGPAQQNVIAKALKEQDSSIFLHQLQMHGTVTMSSLREGGLLSVASISFGRPLSDHQTLMSEQSNGLALSLLAPSLASPIAESFFSSLLHFPSRHRISSL